MNQNAARGLKAEMVFRDTLPSHPSVIEILKSEFNIIGELSHLFKVESNVKCDIRIVFNSGNYNNSGTSFHIDASIKSYKGSGYNQLTRMTIDRFASKFNLDDEIKDDLKQLILRKSSSPDTLLLFPRDKQDFYKQIMSEIAKEIAKDSLSDTPEKEILVLYSLDSNIMRIWKMTQVLNDISSSIRFTDKGNMRIGGCIALQRKGGNGERVDHIDRTSIKHPGNQIQTKLSMSKFIEMYEKDMLASYNPYPNGHNQLEPYR